MSVYVLSPAEFSAIAMTLHVSYGRYGPLLFPLSMTERWRHSVIVEPRENIDEETYKTSLIEPFVFRLYLANAIAERYTYMKDQTKEFVIPVIELKQGGVLPLRKLLSLLETLRYNIVTNGGNSFLGVHDDEKLNRVIEDIKTELIPKDE